MKEIAIFHLGERIIEVPVPARNSESKPGLANFGVIIEPNRFRGGWPQHLDGLHDLGVRSILSLYTASDEGELRRITGLQEEVTKTSIIHKVVSVSNTNTFVGAAKLFLELNEPAYLVVQVQIGLVL